MASLPSPTLVSLERKRARDRRAQRNFRHKKNDQIVMLERRLQACNEQIASYVARIQDLENICTRQQTVQLLRENPHDVGSRWSFQIDVAHPDCQSQSSHLTNLPVSQCPCYHTSQSSEGPSCCHASSRTTKIFLPNSVYQPTTDNAEHLPPNISHTPSQDTIAPQWSLTPPQGSFIWDSLPIYSPWGADLQMVQESPDFPTPLELLYGSRRNKLANFIHDISRLWGCHDPERLACGWLSYALVKWMVEPTECRFKRIPEFLRPMPEQLRHAYPACINTIVFPQLRINLMSKHNLCDFNEVLGMLSCCIKVRWPWGKNFLTPSDDAGLHMSPEFYNTFTRLSGWGLTGEFISKYPGLLEQIDIETVHYRVA